MKKFLLFIFNICIFIKIYGQCIDTYPILTTDPGASKQLRIGNDVINRFDWTRDIYDDVFITQSANGSNPECTEINAPWNQINSGNPNMVPLIDQKLSNPNVLDIYPIDGWELIYVKMGRKVIQQNGGTRNESVSNPSFAIYNRRTGHIKYFMGLTSTTFASARVLNITIEYTNNRLGNYIVGAMLNHRDSLQFILPEFNPNVKQMGQSSFDGRPILDEACNDRIWWITADFWTQFDPCTCYPNYETKVKFFVQFIDNKKITMNIDGDVSGDFTRSLFQGSDTYLDNSTLQKSKFDGVLGNASAAIDGIVKGYKNADALNDFAMKLVTPKVVSGVTKPPLLKGIAAKKIAAKGAIFGPKGLIIAAGIGLMYSFAKANKVSNNNPRYATPKPLTYEGNFKVKLTANGTISALPQDIFENRFVPGSPNQPIAFDYQKPVYNNVLGIISFTELPTLQYITWSNYGQTSRNGSVYNNFQVRQYKLEDNPIKYIVNPASGLEIESIKAQLVINLNDERNSWLEVNPNVDMDYAPPFTGPFQFGATKYNYCEGENDFEKKINASGLEIVNWVSSAENYAQVVYGTPFVDLPCIHDQTFLLSRNDALNNFKVYIKFHVIFKVVNKFGTQTGPEGSEGLQNDEEELIEYIVTYPININEQPFDNVSRHFCIGNIIPGTNQINCNNYGILDQLNYTPHNYRDDMFFTPINNSPMSPWPNINNKEVLPVSLLFENTSLSGNQNYKAQKNITIGNNVTVQNGSDIYLTAGESIEVSDLFESNEFLHLDIGLNPSNYIGVCEPSNYNSIPDINTICQNNGPYYQKTRSLDKTDETINDVEHFQTQMINNVRLFPNPVTDYTTIHFNILNDVKINVELFDINGQLISTLASNKFYPIGDYEMPLSLQGLRQGVYLLILIDENGLKMAHKVIKQ